MRFSQARTEVFLISQNVRFILFLRKTERIILLKYLKIQLDIDFLKIIIIILLDHQNNYQKRSKYLLKTLFIMLEHST